MISRTSTYSIFPRFFTLLKFPRISLKISWIMPLILISVLLVFYIFQINEMTKAGYLTKTYEQKISQLSKENKVLKIAFSQSGSLDNLEEKIKDLNYEKTEKIHYIEVLENQVVSK